jgi:hypothetical protein
VRNGTDRHPRVRGVAAAAIIVTGSVVVGALAMVAPGIALMVAVGTATAAVAVGGVLPVLLLALPAVFVVRRVGPGALNMSVTDVTMVITALLALPFVPWRNPHVRRVAWAMGAYMAVLGVTVAATPTQRAVVEWLHRGSILFGGLLVGAALAHHGGLRAAFRAFGLAAAFVAVAAILQSVGTGFQPAFPLGMQKNPAGALMAMALVLLVVAPAVWRLGPHSVRALQAVLLLGVLATQSRGAIGALFIALALWSLVREGRAARAVVVIPAGVVVVLAIVISLRADEQRAINVEFTPEHARRISYEAAMKEWRRNPIVGSGLRYFRAPGYRFDVPKYRDTYVEPHSVWYSTLAESGVIGLAALTLLLGTTFLTLRRVAGPVALAAGLVLVVKLATGMVDIYWVAGTQTLPWLVVGLAVAYRRPVSVRTGNEVLPQRMLAHH